MISDMHEVRLSEFEIELINLLREDDPERLFELRITRRKGRYDISLKQSVNGSVSWLCADRPEFDEAWFDMTPPEHREPARRPLEHPSLPKPKIVLDPESP